MKVLSLPQPWASFVAEGAKRCVEAALPTDYRGQVAIHAPHMRLAQTFTPYVEKAMVLRDWMSPDALPAGLIIATARLHNCVPVRLVGADLRGVAGEEVVSSWTLDQLEFADEQEAGHEAGMLMAGRMPKGTYVFDIRDVVRLESPVRFDDAFGFAWIDDEKMA